MKVGHWKHPRRPEAMGDIEWSRCQLVLALALMKIVYCSLPRRDGSQLLLLPTGDPPGRAQLSSPASWVSNGWASVSLLIASCS
jgi:hypothetical protein